jgi:phage terminase large subunit-like protein
MDYVDKAERYIKKVITGKIDACLFVRQACTRQVNDLKKKKTKKFPYIFDRKKANRVCQFIENLSHVKGVKAGEPVHLEDWQCFILTTVFGWLKEDGARRFTQTYIEVPRGNGKSTLCSGIALYMECADGEQGAEVYSFATTREQAGIVFGDALAMARGNKDFKNYFGVTCLNHSVIVLGTNSKFMAKSSDAGTLDGLNTHCGIIDELHAHKTRHVYDVVISSIGKRAQPLVFCITTAGFYLHGICMERRKTTAKVLAGAVSIDSLFGIIYTIDEDDDWKTEKAVIKANPNWGVSVNPDIMRGELANALVNTSAQKNYLTKHLDVWVNSDSAWLDMAKYNACIDTSFTPEDFAGKPCIYGVDLASKLDLSAVIKLFWKKNQDDGLIHYYVWADFFLPSDTVKNSGNTSYYGWVEDGHLRTTDGAITDIGQIEQFIIEDYKKFDTLSVAYDPMQATQMAQGLLQDGAPMVELYQNLKNLSEPMKTLQALMYSGRLHVLNNPVLHWNAANVVAHTDAKENIFPRKEKPEDKIDGIVALIMAFNQAIFLDVENNYVDRDEKPRDWSIFKLF